jgi:acetyl esterase
MVRTPQGHALPRIRRFWNYAARALSGRTPVATVQERLIDGTSGNIRIRVYGPSKSDAPSPALIWFHGGGFMVGGLDTADPICRQIASISGAAVVAVQYRLAPEHDLYAGREDGFAALDWIARNGVSIGIDASRLAVGGDSAGGNIAAAIAQECARRKGPKLRLQVLVYPATNLADEFPSLRENARGYLVTAETIDWIKGILGQFNAQDAWLSPAHNENWVELAPALILTAGFDPIRDDGLAYAKRLRAEGIPVELLHYPGQFHGFVNFDAILRTSRDALHRIATSLAVALADNSNQSAELEPISRTIEIGIQENVRQTLLSDVVIASLLAGEWLELKRDRFLGRLWPWQLPPIVLKLKSAISPATTIRHYLATRYAKLHACETFTIKSASSELIKPKNT